MEKLVELGAVPADTGASSFSALLRQAGDEIRRDVFSCVAPQETEGGVLQAGYAIIYPGCQTKGHQHADREEVFHIVRGQGVMRVDDREVNVAAGDTFYVPFGLFHATRNPHNLPLEFFWVTVQKK